jgi:hypothetical protein
MANGLMKFGKDWSYLLPANVFFCQTALAAPSRKWWKVFRDTCVRKGAFF